MLKIVCPNDASHNTFCVNVHVVQTWVTDKTGKYIESKEGIVDTTRYPNRKDKWTCDECGAIAMVKG